jgi:hypothetical protein
LLSRNDFRLALKDCEVRGSIRTVFGHPSYIFKVSSR